MYAALLERRKKAYPNGKSETSQKTPIKKFCPKSDALFVIGGAVETPCKDKKDNNDSVDGAGAEGREVGVSIRPAPGACWCRLRPVL